MSIGNCNHLSNGLSHTLCQRNRHCVTYSIRIKKVFIGDESSGFCLDMHTLQSFRFRETKVSNSNEAVKVQAY